MRLCLWQPTQTDLLLSVSLDRGPPSPSAILPRASSLWRRRGSRVSCLLPRPPPQQWGPHNTPQPPTSCPHTSASPARGFTLQVSCSVCRGWENCPSSRFFSLLFSPSPPHPTSLSSFRPHFSLSAPSPPSGCQRLLAHILNSPAEENHMTGTVNQNHTFSLGNRTSSSNFIQFK